MIRVDDDMKRTLTFGTAPKRVVSLVPSDTFTVAALGCGGALVGRTDYCELPAEIVAGVPSVGGTKNPKLEAILDLSPDLVIANQEENTKKDLETLAQKGVKVFVAFPRRAADGIAHLARLARVFHVAGDRDVRELIRRGYEVIREAEEARQTVTPLRTFCPIWMKPLMTIHGATFISDILDLAGAQNVFADRDRSHVEGHEVEVRERPGPDPDLGAVVAEERRTDLDPLTDAGAELAQDALALVGSLDRRSVVLLAENGRAPALPLELRVARDVGIPRKHPLPLRATVCVVRHAGSVRSNARRARPIVEALPWRRPKQDGSTSGPSRPRRPAAFA